MRILMVCLGNICRSPLAHGVMEHIVKQEELGWIVDSAGTGDWHVGQAPDPRSVAVARKNGVDISAQRAQHFTKDLFDKYDYIFVMDRQNYKDVISQGVNQEQKDKVKLFLAEDVVPDPYYDSTMFEPVFDLINARCKVLIEELKNK